MSVIYTIPNIEYNTEAGGAPAGQIRVTIMHWRASLTEGLNTSSSYGTVSAEDQNRVYTLAALEQVPESVMLGWLEQALGQEEMDRIEAHLQAANAAKADPPTGNLTPGE